MIASRNICVSLYMLCVGSVYAGQLLRVRNIYYDADRTDALTDQVGAQTSFKPCLILVFLIWYPLC